MVKTRYNSGAFKIASTSDAVLLAESDSRILRILDPTSVETLLPEHTRSHLCG